jgi:hypothetical protein
MNFLFLLIGSSATTSIIATGTCADGFHEVNPSGLVTADTCVAHTVCGNQADGSTARTATTAATATNDATCALCTIGSFGENSGDCTACTPIENGKESGWVIKCTNLMDSKRDSKKLVKNPSPLCTMSCAVGFFYDEIATPVTDGCVTNSYTAGVCSPVTECAGNTDGTGGQTVRVEVNAPGVTTDRTCTSCDNGFWAAGNGNCMPCTPIENVADAVCGSIDAATYTCSSATNTQRASGQCASGFWLDTSGIADVCTAHTVCGKQMPVGSDTAVARTTTTDGTVTADTVCEVNIYMYILFLIFLEGAIVGSRLHSLTVTHFYIYDLLSFPLIFSPT